MPPKQRTPPAYTVPRKLQEIAGSYFLNLPKVWIARLGLKEGVELLVSFDDTNVIRITAPTEIVHVS